MSNIPKSLKHWEIEKPHQYTNEDSQGHETSRWRVFAKHIPTGEYSLALGQTPEQAKEALLSQMDNRDAELRNRSAQKFIADNALDLLRQIPLGEHSTDDGYPCLCSQCEFRRKVSLFLEVILP